MLVKVDRISTELQLEISTKKRQRLLLSHIGARRYGLEGALASLPLWKCCKVFLRISSYSKTLRKRNIYALFL